MNLPKAFEQCARKNERRPALFWGETEFNYGQLLEQSEAVANHLRQERRVQPGERVGLWLKNCPEFVPALFGILGAGGVVVPINNFLKPDEVAFILADAGIRVLVTEKGSEEHLARLRSLQPQLECWLVDDLPQLPGRAAKQPSTLASSERTEADLAVIIYTSGTTGRPKGAMLSHGNLLCNIDSCRVVLEAVDVDRFVVVLPMFHSFMLCVGVLLPLLVGGSMVLIRSLHPPKNVLQEIIHRQGTILPAIPQFFRMLASAPIDEKLPLRVCFSGGAPLPAEILREFNSRMPLPLLEGYGLSEASPVVCINPVHGPWKDGSIGVPIPGRRSQRSG